MFGVKFTISVEMRFWNWFFASIYSDLSCKCKVDQVNNFPIICIIPTYISTWLYCKLYNIYTVVPFILQLFLQVCVAVLYPCVLSVTFRRHSMMRKHDNLITAEGFPEQRILLYLILISIRSTLHKSLPHVIEKLLIARTSTATCQKTTEVFVNRH